MICGISGCVSQKAKRLELEKKQKIARMMLIETFVVLSVKLDEMQKKQEREFGSRYVRSCPVCSEIWSKAHAEIDCDSR